MIQFHLGFKKRGIGISIWLRKAGLRIGILGTMGYGLESSIATSKISGYEFGSPVPIIESYAYHLRTVEEVDMVIVVSHDSGNLNRGVSQLSGDYKVDAIFNAHSHSEYYQDEEGIPIIQSGHNGEFVGHIRFEFNDGVIESFSGENLSYYDNVLFQTENSTVQDLIDIYQLETDELFNTPIIVAGEDLSQTELSNWIAKLMRITTGSDIAFHNLGGTRTDVDDGETINVSLLYQIWPFDNFIKTTYLTGSQINTLRAGKSNVYDTDIELFEADAYYKVATNDYLFDKDYYPFINGLYSSNTGLLLRDIAVSELELQNVLNSYFFISNEIRSVSLVPEEDPFQATTN